jgi:hypothetical protein
MIGTSDLVLHALRCIGGAGLARVATATGLDRDAAESELIDLAVAGLVAHGAGEFGGWSLTADGRAADAERSVAELADDGVRTAITAAYDRFLVLNPELLDICTAWQTRRVDGVVVANRHDDAAHDARVLDQLADLAGRADALCADLAAALPRFGRYRVRLGDALAMARSGRPEYVTDDFEAYHTVWFQLHEDLLATLGIPR